MQYSNTDYLFPAPVKINSVVASAGPFTYPYTAADVKGTSITNGINYNVYSFASVSTTTSYTVNYSCLNPTIVYVLAVGGGGGGGGGGGACGGGGAGGVVMNPVYITNSGTITIAVGAGGGGNVNGTATTVSFSANTYGNVYAYGGGGGGYSGSTLGKAGGSSGGNAWNTTINNINSPSPINTLFNYGNFGGGTTTNNTTCGGGGGGGAGTNGILGTASYNGGNGGNGIQCYLPGIKDFTPSGISYNTYYWGGGGGGGSTNPISSNNGNGGIGGGGGGGVNGSGTIRVGGSGINAGGNGEINDGNGGSGGANTGGGGGGTWDLTGGTGGSGIVIIAFPSSTVTDNQSTVLPASIYGSGLYSATLNNATFSPLAYNTIKCAFACRLINYNYFGPIMTLRHSLDTTGIYTKNFYSDICGNMGTGYLGTGQPLSTWLTTNGANTTYAFVTKWYGQGMDVSFNSATQYTITAQPIYDVANGVINYGYTGGTGVSAIYPGYMQLPTNFFPPNDSSYSIVTRYYNFGTLYADTQQDVLMVGNTGNTGQVGRLGFNLNGNPANYLSGAPGTTGTTLATTNGVITYKYTSFTTVGNSGSNFQIYQNGSQSASAAKTSATAAYSQGSTYIGNTSFDQYANSGVFSGTNYFLQAQLYNLYVFNSALSDSDRLILEATPYQFSVLPSFTITPTSIYTATSTTFTMTWPVPTGASIYLMYINSSYYGQVTSGQLITPLTTPPWNVNVIAYNLTNNIVATSYNNFQGLFSFPPGNLSTTSYTTTFSGLTYGNGSYITSASSQRNGAYTSNGAYINTVPTSVFLQYTMPATATTTDNNSNVYSGEWVQIQLPSAIVINGYSQYNNAGTSVSGWALLGSNNGTTWILLDSRTSYTIQQNYPTYVFPVSTSTAYNYYRFVLTSATHPYPAVQGLQFYSNTKI